jgi:uncharacterized protein
MADWMLSPGDSCAPDIDATLAAVEKAGGAIVVPRTDVFGLGEFAQFRDPDGNLIGLWHE